MKNGTPAVNGMCETCGTKMFKISRGRVETPPTDGRVPRHAAVVTAAA